MIASSSIRPVAPVFFISPDSATGDKRLRRLATHISPGDTSESHRALNLVDLLTLGDDIVYVLEQTSSDSPGITGIGVKGLDNFLDGHWGFSDSPSVVIGRCTDQGVATWSAITQGELGCGGGPTQSPPLVRAWPRG